MNVMVEFRRECIPTAELNKAGGCPVNPRPGYVLMIKLWNRNMELFGLKVTFKRHLIQPPAVSRDMSHAERGQHPNTALGKVTATCCTAPGPFLGRTGQSCTQKNAWMVKSHHLCLCLIPLWVANTEAAALCQSLCADTLCLFSPCPRVLYDCDLGQVWDTPLCILGLQSCEMPPWEQHLFFSEISWNSEIQSLALGPCLSCVISLPFLPMH